MKYITYLLLLSFTLLSKDPTSNVGPDVSVKVNVVQIVGQGIPHLRGKHIPEFINKLPPELRAAFVAQLSPEQRKDFIELATFDDFKDWAALHTRQSFEEIRALFQAEGINLPEHPQLIKDLSSIQDSAEWRSAGIKTGILFTGPLAVPIFIFIGIVSIGQNRPDLFYDAQARELLSNYLKEHTHETT